MRTHDTCLPFYWNFQEKQVLKGIPVRKSPCIMIKGHKKEMYLQNE